MVFPRVNAKIKSLVLRLKENWPNVKIAFLKTLFVNLSKVNFLTKKKENNFTKKTLYSHVQPHIKLKLKSSIQ